MRTRSPQKIFFSQFSSGHHFILFPFLSFSFFLFCCCETVIQSEKGVCKASLSAYAIPPGPQGFLGVCLFAITIDGMYISVISLLVY